MFQGLTFVALFLLLGLRGISLMVKPNPNCYLLLHGVSYCIRLIALPVTALKYIGVKKNWLVTGKACFRKYSAGKKP